MWATTAVDLTNTAVSSQVETSQITVIMIPYKKKYIMFMVIHMKKIWKEEEGGFAGTDVKLNQL